MPVWHASVAKHGRDGLIPVSEWRARDRERAQALLAHTIDGVGDAVEVHEVLSKSIQVRRLASAAERVVIGPTKDTRR